MLGRLAEAPQRVEVAVHDLQRALEPVLGGAKIGTVTWFTLYWASRYQTSMPGAF